MTEPQSIASLVLQAVIGIAAAVAAYYGYKNHGMAVSTNQVAKSNAAKIDAVQATATALTPPP